MGDCHGDKDSARPTCGEGTPLSLNPLTFRAHGKVPRGVYGLVFCLAWFLCHIFLDVPRSE